MYKLKKVVMLGLILTSLSGGANAAVEEKGCTVLTSQPNYSTMTLVGNDSYVAGIAMVDSKSHKYKGFALAYKEFDASCKKYIRQRCEKDHLKGAVNYRVQPVISDKMYYLSAQFDYFR